MILEPMQLWQAAKTRCLITQVVAAPPYAVSVFEGTVLLSRHEFERHDDAVTHAIDELHKVSPSR
jgi:hypothetical protein